MAKLKRRSGRKPPSVKRNPPSKTSQRLSWNRAILAAWRRLNRKWKIAAVATAVLALVGLVASGFDLWDRARGWFDASSQPVEKGDLADIRRELGRIGSSLSGAGGYQIDAELEAQLRRMLGNGSTAYRVVSDHLRHGRLHEAIATLDRFAEVDLHAIPPDARSAADKLYLSALLQSRVNLSASAARLRRALALDPTRDDIRSTLTIILLNQNNLSEAASTLQPALARADSSAFLSNTVGLLRLAQGDLDGAESYFRTVLSTTGAGLDPRNEAAALGNLGNLYDERGDLPNARRYYQLSIAANRGVAPELDGNQYCNLGRNALQRNDLAAAETYFQLSIDIFRFAESRTCLPNALGGLGTVRFAQGRMAHAESLFRRSFEAARELGNPDAQVVVLANMALIRDRQRSHQAKSYLIRALGISLRQDQASVAFERHGNIVLRLLLDGEIASRDDIRAAMTLLVPAIRESEEHSRSSIQLTLSTAWLTCAIGYYDPFGAAERIIFSEAERRRDPRLLAELARGIVRVQRRYERDCGLPRDWQL